MMNKEESSLTAGKNGPVLLQDVRLIDKLTWAEDLGKVRKVCRINLVSPIRRVEVEIFPVTSASTKSARRSRLGEKKTKDTRTKEPEPYGL